MLLPFNHCSPLSLFPWCLFANLKLIKLNLIQTIFYPYFIELNLIQLWPFFFLLNCILFMLTIIHEVKNVFGLFDFQKNHKLSMHNTNRKSSHSKNYYFPTTYMNQDRTLINFKKKKHHVNKSESTIDMFTLDDFRQRKHRKTHLHLNFLRQMKKNRFLSLYMRVK